MASAITPEEFAAWQANPVTEWVLAACRVAAEQCREAWIEASWHSGNADPMLRLELSTRADAYEALAGTAYEGWLKTHGEEPE